MKNLIKYFRIDKVRISRFDRSILYTFIFLAVFGDFIANDKPILYKQDGHLSMPILSAYLSDITQLKGSFIHRNWHQMEFDFVIRAPIPYSASFIDMKNAKFRSPFSAQDVKSNFFRHWLGTDGLGRDVLAGLVHGCRIAFVIGVISTVFALLIGVPIGTAMGYWGNHRMKTNLAGCITIIILGVLILMSLIIVIQLFVKGIYPFWKVLLYSVICSALCLGVRHGMIKYNLWRKSASILIPLDHIGMRIIEILRSIPGLFLVLACLGLMARPSMFYIAFLIGFIRWPTITRYVRAEVMKVKSMAYIKSAETLGLSRSQIVFRHLLPNALSPVLVTIAFGFSSAILVESALSFLGLGLNIEEMSWGKLLFQARSRFDAWWLVFFPGMMIFLTIYVFNRIGNQVNAVFNPRLGTPQD